MLLIVLLLLTVLFLLLIVLFLLLIVLFYVLFVCKCVLYYCHKMSTQLQLANIWIIKYQTQKLIVDNMECNVIL